MGLNVSHGWEWNESGHRHDFQVQGALMVHQPVSMSSRVSRVYKLVLLGVQQWAGAGGFFFAHTGLNDLHGS